jgi:hypothetical protein
MRISSISSLSETAERFAAADHHGDDDADGR